MAADHGALSAGDGEVDVFAAFFDCACDGNDFEVAGVDVGFGLVGVTDRSLGEAADGAEQLGGLDVIGADVGADAAEEVVAGAQAEDVDAQTVGGDGFVVVGELFGPVGGEGGGGRSVFERAALRDGLAGGRGVLFWHLRGGLRHGEG